MSFFDGLLLFSNELVLGPFGFEFTKKYIQIFSALLFKGIIKYAISKLLRRKEAFAITLCSEKRFVLFFREQTE